MSSATNLELEIVLRQWTHRLRVVNELSGKSHLLLIGRETIAVRVYFPNDINRFEQECSKQNDSDKQNCSGFDLEKYLSQYLKQIKRDNEREMIESRQNMDSRHKEKFRAAPSETTIQTNKCNDYIDDDHCFKVFRQSFKYSTVFFVLPPGKLHLDQLSCPNSFVMRAQRAFLPYHENAKKMVRKKYNVFFFNLRFYPIIQMPMKTIKSFETFPKKYARVFVVPEVRCILSTLLSISETIQPGKMSLKQDYLNSCSRNNGILSNKHLSDTNNSLLSPPSVVEHKFANLVVANALQNWSVRFGIPKHDVNILLSALGNIASIVSKCNDISDELEHLPITSESKAVLYNFFGSKRSLYARDERNQKKFKFGNHHHHSQESGNLKKQNTQYHNVSSNTSTHGEQNQGHAQSNEQYKTYEQLKRNSSFNIMNVDVDGIDFAQYTMPAAGRYEPHFPRLYRASPFNQGISNPKMGASYGNLQQYQYK